MNKAQAALLATDFLDTLTTEDKSSLQPKETFTELILIAGELAEDAVNNLIESNSNDSGELASSIELDEPEQKGNVVSVNLWMNFYGKFINDGVKGTRSGTGKYSFKNEHVSKKMLAAFIERQKRGTSKSQITKRYKAYGKHEVKQENIAKNNAYFAALMTKMFGIKPTGFMNKATARAEQKIEDSLGAALVIDIYNSI